MEDIELKETCKNCGNHLTLMESISHPEGKLWAVKRCLHCGGHPVEQVAKLSRSVTRNMGESKIEICTFSDDEIEDAVEGLEGLQHLIVPWFKEQNFEDMGEQDAEDCKKHLMMGKTALILMAEGMDLIKAEGRQE